MDDSSCEALSRDDIHSILRNKLKTEFQLISYQLKPFEEKIGLLGDHVILETLVQLPPEDQPKKLSFFAKYFPSNPTQSDFARRTGAFDKEIFTNDELFSKIKQKEIEILGHCTVECHLTDKDRILVFDNLNEEGFETPDKHQELDFASILAVLKSLAKLHASSLIYEEKKTEELGKPYRLTEDYETEFEETFYNDKEDFVNLKGVQASIKAVLTEIDLFEQPPTLLSGKDFKAVAEKLCYQVYDLVRCSNKFRNVISHGDLWSSNLFLKYDERRQPIRCKFVDFQMTRYAPPSHDVMSVLHLTTSRELRKKHMYELIGLYYTALESNLKLAGYDIKALMPFGDFLQSCEEQKPFALMQTATYFQLILLDSDALKAFYADPAFLDYACYEDRSVLVLAQVNKDEVYRRKLKESIEDLREYCERL